MGKRLCFFTGIGILLCLAAFAIAGKARIVRPDILDAVTCTGVYLTDKPTYLDIITANRNAIATEAKAQDLPPEVVAMVIAGHQHFQTINRNFTDCAGSALGYNLSLGLAQVRLSTAIGNAGLDANEITHREFHRLRGELLSPEANIRHAALELRLLLERKNRFPGITAEELLGDTFKLALLLSDYRAGWSNTPAESSRLSANAFSDIRFLLIDMIYLFGREPTRVNQIQEQFRTYLDYIYCDSKIFNERTCIDWQEGLMTQQIAIGLAN